MGFLHIAAPRGLRVHSGDHRVCLAPLARPVLMTFAKLSRGGGVCGAGSRGQDKMLQQIYSLLGMCVSVGGGGGEGPGGGGEPGSTYFTKTLPRWSKRHLNPIRPPERRVPVSLLRLVSQRGGGVGSVRSLSRQSKTGPMKDKFSGALTRDMVCVRK